MNRQNDRMWRKAGLRDFPKIIESQLPCFRQTADKVGIKGLAKIVDEMASQLGDMADLQKLHRNFLMAIDDRRRTPSAVRALRGVRRR